MLLFSLAFRYVCREIDNICVVQCTDCYEFTQHLKSCSDDEYCNCTGGPFFTRPGGDWQSKVDCIRNATSTRSPKITPWKTPFRTVAETPQDTPKITPWKTPFRTVAETPWNTPYKTPIETPNATVSAPTLTPLMEYFRIEERKPENLGLYILYAAFTLSGAILLIAVIYFAFIYKKSQHESSTSSSESLSVPEKVVSLEAFGPTITINSAQVPSDDPFAEDFQSDPPFEVSDEYFLALEKD